MNRHMNPRKIVTECIRPPIPIRQFDWRATYAGYEPGDPMGYGATEAEAMADLVLNATDEGGKWAEFPG